MAGGARTGEITNLRWRDWTPLYKNGLGRLLIASSFNSREKLEKGTKTGAKKFIPVHPFVRAVLEDWHEYGWREYMGREPRPEDLILPRLDGQQWRNGQLLTLFHADLDVLGIPRQRQYENRSTFRNLLLRAGAPEFIVNLMTHPSPKQASDAYTRIEMQWPALCSAIRAGYSEPVHEQKSPRSRGPGAGTAWRGVRDSKPTNTNSVTVEGHG